MYRFGYVEYSSSKDAQKALKKMDGADLGGRQIRVDMANPPSSGGGGGRGRGGMCVHGCLSVCL